MLRLETENRGKNELDRLLGSKIARGERAVRLRDEIEDKESEIWRLVLRIGV